MHIEKISKLCKLNAGRSGGCNYFCFLFLNEKEEGIFEINFGSLTCEWYTNYHKLKPNMLSKTIAKNPVYFDHSFFPFKL